MSGPNFDFLRDTSPAGENTEFDFLRDNAPTQDDPEKPQTFRAWGNNLVRNFISLRAAATQNENENRMANGLMPVTDYNTTAARAFGLNDDKQIKIYREALKNTQDGGSEALNDFNNFFSKTFVEPAQQIAATLASPGDFVEGIKQDPWGAGGQFMKGLVEPIADYLEAMYGVDLTQEARALTATERADKAKGAFAAGISALVTLGAARALPAAAAASKSAMIAGRMDTPAALALSKSTYISGKTGGKFGKDLLRGTALGGVAGGTYGAVRFANEEDQLSQILINGVMFAPLGAAFELVGVRGRKKEYNNVALAAGEYARLRQAQPTMENVTIQGTVKQLEAFKTADSMNEAILNGTIDLDPTTPVLISGVTLDITKQHISTKLRDKNISKLEHYRKDGLVDHLYVHNEQLNDRSRKFFSDFGFIPEQLVSASGRGEYIIKNALKNKDGDITFQVEEVVTGRVSSRPARQIRHLANLEMDVGVIQLESPLRNKARLIKQAEVSGHVDETPMAKASSAAVLAAKTGQPLSVVSYRYNRGGLVSVAGAGKFYGVTPGGIGGYAQIEAASKNKNFFDAVRPDALPKDLSKLHVHRLNFENPLVIDGGHQDIAKNIPLDNPKIASLIARLDAAIEVRNRTPSETGYQLMGKINAEIAKALGHDGIIYRKKGRMDRSEIVDLRGKPIMDVPEGIKVTRVAVPDKTSFYSRLAQQWKRSLTDPSDEQIVARTAGKKIVELTDAELDIHYWNNNAKRRDLYEKRPFNYDELNIEFVNRHDELSAEIKRRKMDVNAPDSQLKTTELLRRSKDKNYFEMTWAELNAHRIQLKSDLSNIVNSNKLDEVIKLLNERSRLGSRLSSTIEPIAFKDWTPPDDFSFVKSIEEFALTKGFTKEDMPALTRLMQKETFNDMLKTMLTGDERVVYERMLNELDESISRTSQAIHERKELDVDKLINAANSNGMYVQLEDAGVVGLRDVESRRLLMKFKDYADAAKFIRESAQAKGVDIDKDFAVPPGAVGGELLGGMGDRPPRPPDVFGRNGKLTEIYNTLAINTHWLTPNRQIALSLDSKYGTEFFTKVFDAPQNARKKANAVIHPWYTKLLDVDKKTVGMSKREREVIGQYLEAVTPDEFIARGMSRNLTPIEQTLGKKLSESGVDIDRVFEYNGHVERIIMKQHKPDTPEFNAALDAAKKQFGMDDAHLEASELFDEIQFMNMREASLGAITTLARLHNGPNGLPAMGRDAHAAHHKMSLEQVAVANNLESMFKDLAKEFGINPQQMLNFYFTHARLHTNGNVQLALDHFSGDTKAKEFYAKLHRTGELNAYETDPIRAMQRYIKAGFDSKHFSEVYAQARKDAAEQLESKKLPVGERKRAERFVNNYLADLQGHPGADVLATQTSVDDLFTKLKLDVSVDVKKNIVNTILATGEAAAQGFRMAAGLRDFSTGIIFSYGRFGTKYTAEMLYYGTRGLDGVTHKELERMGVFNQASPIMLQDPVERATTVIGRTTNRSSRALRKFNDAAFKLSGQKDVYALMHAGHYLATWKRAGEGLRKMRDVKNYTLDNLRDDLQLGKFQEPVIREFERLVAKGEHEQAATFLGTQAGYDMVGVYGLANHPNLWGSNTGRVAGQFGNWSAWALSQASQTVSRGTMGQRVAALARFSVATYAVNQVGEAMGFDLDSWNPAKGLLFSGGPALKSAITISEAISGTGYRQKQAQREVLRILPYSPEALGGTGEINPAHLYIPGSYFARDLAKAYDLAERGFNPLAVGGQALGVKVDQSQRSIADDFFGSTPQLKR